MNLIVVVVLFGLIGILFYELFVRLEVSADIRQVFSVAPGAVKVIRSTSLSDEQKEESVRRMSVIVLKDTCTFTLKVGFILLSCVALAAVVQSLFAPSSDGLGALLMSWQGLIAAVVAVALYRRFKPVGGRAGSRIGSGKYSVLDRLLHRVAFIHPGLQKVLGDVENDMFKSQLANIDVGRPVFVTGLPRAGTTLLLELLHDTGQFASFTYRQMPFVLNPLLWNRLSSGSRKRGEFEERAHGDGMLVSYDSPEAFEEVLWVNSLGSTLFEDGGMRPIEPADLDTRFRESFVELARKLVCLKELGARGAKSSSSSIPGLATSHGSTAKSGSSGSRTPAAGSSLRYLSKNNANLSRLPAIRSVFSDADLLLCYRHPSTQVASLHTQHLRFLDMHRDDRFARDYMRWIGHHDFGANFRPIRFNDRIDLDPTDRLFWLQYWIDAYRFVLEHAPERTQFIGYESLLSGGAANLGRLASRLDLDDAATAALIASATRLRVPAGHVEPLTDLSTDLSAEAEAIYAALSARSVEQGYGQPVSDERFG